MLVFGINLSPDRFFLFFWQEPLRVAMANYLRSLMQTAISQDVLEQAVNLVTNDNLDLGCAVIEKAATEKVFFIFSSWF